jgi:DNA-binding transcriptional MerR regulator
MKTILKELRLTLEKVSEALDVRADREGDKAERETDALDELQGALETAIDEFEAAWEE